MTELSPRAFTAVIFRNAKRIAGCHVRVGGMFSTDGIACSSNENAGENSFKVVGIPVAFQRSWREGMPRASSTELDSPNQPDHRTKVPISNASR